MTAAKFAAYLGAAAWIPQLARLLYWRFVRPVVSIVPEQSAEIGFTVYGPIFNIRMAFSVDRKSTVIDGFNLVLRHADGETRTLRWAGMSETFSEITDQAGNRQTVSRDQSPVALKLGTEALTEKFVRFQEPRYHETVQLALSKLVSHFEFLKKRGGDFVTATLASKEFHELLEARQNSFWWRAGRYDMNVRLSSLKPISITKADYSFELTSSQINQLQENVEKLKTQLENTIRSNLPDFQMVPLNWTWVYATISQNKSAGCG
jgi:hypothetical protein